MPSALGIVASGRRASASAYSAAVLADSPLGYWRLGEASGTTAADSSGNSRSGIYSGGPTLGAAGLVTGDAATSVDLDGSNDQVSVGYASWFDTDFITVEAIVRPDAFGGERQIMDRDGTARIFQFRFETDGRPNFFPWNSGGTVVGATSSAALSTGTPYHIAGTFDGSNVRLYVNGSQVASAALGGVLQKGSTPLAIGASQGGSFFDGRFQEAAYYGTALSAARILDHAQKAGLA